MTFNHPINTTRGPATFIAPMFDGQSVQVSRKVKATELTRGECEKRKISVIEMDTAQFNEWRRTASFVINEIIPLSEVIA